MSTNSEESQGELPQEEAPQKETAPQTVEQKEVHEVEVAPKTVEPVDPDTQRCSSCGKWKPTNQFDGKATCNECRPKKRRQGAAAVAERRAAMDKISEQNTTLMFLVKQQAVELAQRRVEDQRQKEIIVHMQREIKQLRAYIETKGRSVYVPEKPETNINAPDLLAAAMTWTQGLTPEDIRGEAENIRKKSRKNPPPSSTDFGKFSMLPPFASSFKHNLGMDYNFLQGDTSMPPTIDYGSIPFSSMVCSAE
jgi:hypothetical protein